MSNVIKLEFDDGCKTIELNNDPNKVIRFNPTDAKFIQRLSNVDNTINKIQKKYGDIDMQSILEIENLDPESPDFERLKSASKNMEELEKAMREFINDIFGYDVCSVVFGEDWCISPANGQPRYANFLRCIVDYIMSETDSLKSAAQANAINIDISKTDKYTSNIEKLPITAKNPVNVYANPLPDVSKYTPEQKRALMAELSK